MAIASFHYAVIDLAVAEALRPVMVRQLPSIAAPLLSERASRSVLMVGPWLVQYDKCPEIQFLLQSDEIGSSWGYFIDTSIDIISLRQALRKFNLVEIPGAKKPVLFRYWDPRVLEVFLQVATQFQKTKFFEWIDRIETFDGLVQYSAAPDFDER